MYHIARFVLHLLQALTAPNPSTLAEILNIIIGLIPIYSVREWVYDRAEDWPTTVAYTIALLIPLGIAAAAILLIPLSPLSVN